MCDAACQDLQGANQGVIEGMETPFLSICIPSYNRPQTLLRLLRTIDTKAKDVQIVICEDKAPKRLEVRAAVEEFKKETSYDVKYIEGTLGTSSHRPMASTTCTWGMMTGSFLARSTR